MRKILSFASRHKARVLGLGIALLIVAQPIFLNAPTSALTGLFYPTPSTGSYALGAQFNVAISFSNTRVRSPLSITVTPSANLQYAGSSFDSATIASHELTVNANGSLRINVTLTAAKENSLNVIVVTLFLKSTASGPASLVLSNGHSSTSGSKDRDANTQNGNYTIQPKPAPSPTPSPTPTSGQSGGTPSATTNTIPGASTPPIKSSKTTVLPLLEKPAGQSAPATTPATGAAPDTNSLPADTNPANDIPQATANQAQDKKGASPSVSVARALKDPRFIIGGGILALLIILLLRRIARRRVNLFEDPPVTAENAAFQDVWAAARRSNSVAPAVTTGLHTPPPDKNYASSEFSGLGAIAPVAVPPPSVVQPPSAPHPVLPPNHTAQPQTQIPSPAAKTATPVATAKPVPKPIPKPIAKPSSPPTVKPAPPPTTKTAPSAARSVPTQTPKPTSPPHHPASKSATQPQAAKRPISPASKIPPPSAQAKPTVIQPIAPPSPPLTATQSPLGVPQAPRSAEQIAAAFPIPYNHTAHAEPQTLVEAKIEEAFYPLEAAKHAPAKPKAHQDEPLDMFEMAKRFPQSFGSDLYVDPATQPPPPPQPPHRPPPKQK